MSMKPFDQKPQALTDALMDWQRMYPQPYKKSEVDPYTKLRIILMNGIEVEAALFSHNLHRRTENQDLRRVLALMRRTEQQQQKRINWLKPLDETPLENTIGYEHVAVDLTAWLAQNEPDVYVKQALDFALLEDFDHLYRYANLLDMDTGIKADQLILQYCEITPGRPTISEFRHPYDDVRRHVDFTTADIRTKLNCMIITAGEQQTMNFYMNTGNAYRNDIGRQLYMEIGLIEEQHVSHYGALIDPRMTGLESLLMHEYVECYLYHSFYETEVCAYTKSIWEQHLEMELAHLQVAARLLEEHEGTHWSQLVPDTFPKALCFEQQKAYVRQVLRDQVDLSSDKEDYKRVADLPPQHDFFAYQERTNTDTQRVASHIVPQSHMDVFGSDFRFEESPNPVEALRDRKTDNVDVGRT